jgi:GT2 family glycosyltransferase
VPIYNNFEDVSALLESLHLTLGDNLSVVLVDDCSPDDRIVPLLSSWADRHQHWRVFRNTENLGFADTVNRGIQVAEGHPIVVNSDIQFPPGWIERLLAPILTDPEGVASVTPFSNHSSFTGFPRARTETALHQIGELGAVDEAFRELRPVLVDLPAGIGFCMAMNRDVVNRIGGLDGKSYGRGYYEDTDWGQRAAASGYRNLVCANLFVHHGVDSKSFSIEQRRELSTNNRKILLQKFPHYDLAERRFYEADPLFEVRVAAQVRLWRQQAKSAYMIIDHAWGGGANDFSDRHCRKLTAEGALVAHITLDRAKAIIRVHYADQVRELEETYSDRVWNLASALDIESVIVNALHGAAKIHDVLSHLTCLADRFPITVYIHDFLAVCPSIFLLKRGHKHCGIPEITQCQACFFDNPNIKYDSFNIIEWRRRWRELLRRAACINVFSNSSRELLLRAFPELPHTAISIVDPDYAIELSSVPLPPSSKTLRIGVVGTMNTHKGSRVVLHLANFIRNNVIDATVTVVGAWNDTPPPKTMSVLGAYQRSELPAILENAKADVILFPSVCPETYSGTLSELFATRLPIVSLPLGAQGERVAQYEFGELAADESPGAIIAAARKAVRKRQAIQ